MMQTKSQIQQLLASAGVRPNKRLGQHFLIDLNLMRLLVERAGMTSQDVVLEVGCGTGSLTEALAEKAGVLVGVEYDRIPAEITTARLSGIGHVEIIHGDILQSKNTFNPKVIEKLITGKKQCPGRLLLVANLPYNVASAVIINLIIGPLVADAIYVTVQKEVADRMLAHPGTPDYGIMSIYLAATGKPDIFRVLKPNVFWPPPQVDSAMVSFVRDPDRIAGIRNMPIFAEVVSLFIGHRRKMMNSCTRSATGKLAPIEHWDRIFSQSGINPTNRPDQITPVQYVSLANQCDIALSER